MAKLIDLNGLAHVYSIIKGMLADKLGKNDTAANAAKVNGLTVETAVPKNAKFTDTVYTHPPTHPASMITGLAAIAESGSYNDLSDKPTIPEAITVDAEISSTSENPVQNKVIKENMDKLFESIISRFKALAANIPTKVSALENDAGYLTQHQSLAGYTKTSEANTWTAQQNFYDLMLNREKYTTYVVNGTSDTPITSTMVYAVTGAFTLDLATLAGALSASQSSVFTAYFAANADYSLTISNAGKLKYTGSASDVAITSAGLLLNVWMSKDGGGTLTSIVQASKLS